MNRPNYERILEAHILGVQRAYGEYKRALKDYLDSSWFDVNGEFVFSVKCADAFTVAENEYNDILRRMIVFRELLEAGNLTALDQYIKGEGLC